MRTVHRGVFGVLLIVAATLHTGPVGAGDIELAAGVDLVNRYLWRGIELDSGLSLQPSLSATYLFSNDASSIALEGWWHIPLDDHGLVAWKDLVFEQDFTLSVSHAVSDVISLSGGYIYYSNPRSDVAPGWQEYQSDEVFLGADVALGRSSLSTYLYYDFDEIDSCYLDLSYSYELLTDSRLSLTPGAHLGVVDSKDSWFADNGLVDGNLSFAAGYTVSDRISVAGSAGYSRRFDGWQRQSGEDEEYLWAGVSIALQL